MAGHSVDENLETIEFACFHFCGSGSFTGGDDVASAFAGLEDQLVLR